MKIEDFMDALSEVDPKYIEEAALELNGDTTDKIIAFRKKRIKRRRIISTGVSAAACIVLLVMAENFGFFRNAKEAEFRNDDAVGITAQENDSVKKEFMSEDAAIDESVTVEDYVANDANLEEDNGELAADAEEYEDSQIGAEFAKEDIFWEDASFLADLGDIQGTIIWVTVNDRDYPFEQCTLDTRLDTSMRKYLSVNGLKVIFAKNADESVCYAYYELEGVGYIILGESMDEDTFVQGIYQML